MERKQGGIFGLFVTTVYLFHPETQEEVSEKLV